MQVLLSITPTLITQRRGSLAVSGSKYIYGFMNRKGANT